MMELFDGGRRGRRLPKRETLEVVAFTALSLTAAAALLPAIAVKAAVNALSFSKNTENANGERPSSYLIN
ncbi:hypothetical protein [Arthrobacter sp. NQ4]|uniref:hypothetical protein n=1 Tax=Arthrobacter sp. NQ4 TaxID=3027930 RepID=UPI0023B0907D|nr:hypothetical protein [Arthrobacter sp. NQ4]MDE8585913.1 hypothetical protein [Arthrobacter sp. NQ4]